MPPPTHTHRTAGGAGSHQARQFRQARARHSLDNTGISLDSSEIPTDIHGYDIRRVLELHATPDAALRAFQAERGLENEDEDEGDADMEGEEGEQDAQPAHSDIDSTTQLPPAGLKEISSLASWTVSTSKPGCGVAALRHPSTSLFWQSDGPQPHLLTVHFFKQVAISHMRIYLDFENDESYTPTRIQFWAGHATWDMIEFADMTFEQPRGWIPVDFSQVGPIEDDEDEDLDNIDWSKRPELRCFILQVRILENHQNGKDTHLRGLQIFARDEKEDQATGLGGLVDELELKDDSINDKMDIPVRSKDKSRRSEGLPKLKRASWMMEPELR